jgi:hypothetical protein
MTRFVVGDDRSQSTLFPECVSAWGLGADRLAESLICLTSEGPMRGAYSQPAMFQAGSRDTRPARPAATTYRDARHRDLAARYGRHAINKRSLPIWSFALLVFGLMAIAAQPALARCGATTCTQARNGCMGIHCMEEGRRSCLSHCTVEYDRCMQTGEFRGRQCGLKTGLIKK